MRIHARRYDTGEPVEIECAAGCIARIEPLAGTPVGHGHLPWVSPGFVDLQINGGGGQEFSSASLTVDAIEPIVRRHLRDGVTRFCPTVTTASFDVLAHSLRTIAAACRQSDFLARRMPGIHVEGPYISCDDGPRGAHPLLHCRPPDWDEFRRLQDAAEGRIRLLTLSPEYDAAPDFIRRAVASGVVVSLGHTAATGEQIAAAVDAGATMSTHLGNGCHRLLRRHPNYLWDQLADDRLTASLIVDGQHLPPEVVKCLVRAKGAQRCVLVSDLSGLAGLPPGRYGSQLCELEILADGRLVLAGQDQLLAGASRPIGWGIANVMRFAGVELPIAIAMATSQPAALVGWDVHTLSVGEPADLALFRLTNASDPASEPLQVEGVVVDGELIASAR